MANKKIRSDSIQGLIIATKVASVGRDNEWPKVVDFPIDTVLKDKALKIFTECISTRESGGFNAFERTQAATLSLTTAHYLLELQKLELEGNLLPNPTNPKYNIRNPRLDVVQSLSATRSNLAKALKLFSVDDSRTITARKKSYDKTDEVINRALSFDHCDLLA